MRIFCFNDAIFEYKLEKLVFKLELELNRSLSYDKNPDKMNDKYTDIYQTNLKIFNFDQVDKGKIIAFFKNHGFEYMINNNKKRATDKSVALFLLF